MQDLVEGWDKKQIKGLYSKTDIEYEELNSQWKKKYKRERERERERRGMSQYTVNVTT